MLIKSILIAENYTHRIIYQYLINQIFDSLCIMLVEIMKELYLLVTSRYDFIPK